MNSKKLQLRATLQYFNFYFMYDGTCNNDSVLCVTSKLVSCPVREKVAGLTAANTPQAGGARRNSRESDPTLCKFPVEGRTQTSSIDPNASLPLTLSSSDRNLVCDATSYLTAAHPRMPRYRPGLPPRCTVLARVRTVVPTIDPRTPLRKYHRRG